MNPASYYHYYIVIEHSQEEWNATMWLSLLLYLKKSCRVESFSLIAGRGSDYVAVLCSISLALECKGEGAISYLFLHRPLCYHSAYTYI